MLQIILHLPNILDLQTALDPVLSSYIIKCEKFTYGRYVFKHNDGLFNIQIDVFSDNYIK